MIVSHFPALLVVAPLLAAPACLLLPGKQPPWLLATLATWASFGMAVAIADQVTVDGVISYAHGGWAPPWGIEFRIDALNALVILLVTGIGSVIMPFAYRTVLAEVPQASQSGFYAAYLLAFAGLLGIAVTGDVFNLFVFLEISSLSSYILISMARDRRALVAAYQYLVLGTIGATLVLIGIGLLYAMTGTLNMSDLAQRLVAVRDTRTVQTAFAFIVIGVGIKLAHFPLHAWLPNAYTYAPSLVSAFLSATGTKVAFYVLARFIFSIFGAEFSFTLTPFGWAFAGLAMAAVLFASIAALFQDNLKRLLAYSSVAQIGYMVLALGMASSLGLLAGVLHMFNHGLMKGALFLAAGCVFFRLGSMRLTDMRGIARDMPWTMTAFTLAGLSLIGVPSTAGFISKWYLVAAALEREWWPAVILIVGTSLLAAAYLWRVIEAAWMQQPAADRAPLREAPLIMLLPTWVLVIANFWFGIDTELTLGLAGAAVDGLMGVGR